MRHTEIDHTERINRAVQSCLARCYSARDVLPTMAVFLKELRDRDAWNEPDVRKVERAVLRLLRRIVDPAVYPMDATDGPVSDSGSVGPRASRVVGA